MTPRIYIVGTKMTDRPESRRTVFADGAGVGQLREGVDLELSHWIPNRTPEQFKAATSTEICMNYVASGARDYDLVVNNHADADGILSVFTLVAPEAALAHRATIVAAAEMGDFWGWGEREAQVLFQSLTRQFDALEDVNADPQVIYEKSLAHVHAVIDRRFADADVERSLEPLTRCVEWVRDGRVRRREYHTHFVHYSVPADMTAGRLDAALHVPRFNEAISDEGLFWPQARAQADREKIQLVSVEAAEGWYYDLWYPGYLWAETPHRWRAVGLSFVDGSHGYRLSWPALDDAVRDLQAHETHDTSWRIDTGFSLFSSTLGRGFPVVLSAMKNGRPATSALEPDFVAGRLAQVFRSGTSHGQG